MSSTWPAGWRPGSAPDCRSAAGPSSPAREICPAADLVAGSATKDPRDDRPCMRLVRVRPADQQQDDEVDRAHAGRVEVAELLADLALDRQSGDGRAEQTELEERALRGSVGAETRGDHGPTRGRTTDQDRVWAGDHRRRALAGLWQRACPQMS